MSYFIRRLSQEDARLLAHDHIEHVFVVTVRQDAYFQTFVFGEEHYADFEEQYFDEPAARAGHHRIVERLRLLLFQYPNVSETPACDSGGSRRAPRRSGRCVGGPSLGARCLRSRGARTRSGCL